MKQWFPILLVGCAACSCDGGNAPQDAAVDIGVDLGVDATVDFGTDLGVRDSQVDLGLDLGTDGGWSPGSGWVDLELPGCSVYRSTDPSEAYPMNWSPCPSSLPCRSLDLDPQYERLITHEAGQRLPGAPVVLGFIGWDPDRPGALGQNTMVLSTPDALVAAWRIPPQAAAPGTSCLVFPMGSDGVHASVNVFVRSDNSSVLFHDTLERIADLETEIGRLTEGEQLGVGAQYVKPSASHAVTFMGALVWVFGTDGSKQRRGGPLDGLGAPWVFGGNTTVIGSTVMAILDQRYIAAFDDPAAEPTLLYEPPASKRMSALRDDGVHMVWIERDLETDAWELWTSPHAVSAAEMAPRRLGALESAGLPMIGDGLAAVVQNGNELLVFTIADGSLRRFMPGFALVPRVSGVTEDEAFVVGQIDPGLPSRYVRVDLSALDYE